jgi:hypothetical protein
MKEEIFKYTYSGFKVIFSEDSTPIYSHNPKSRSNLKYGYFVPKCETTNEEDYINNYGNPLCYVSRNNFTLVIERDGPKVSLKIYNSGRSRRVGVSWFKISTQCTFFTFNTEKGDFYQGSISGYHKKRKVVKQIRRNYFINRPISNIVHKIKGSITGMDKIQEQEFIRKVLIEFFLVIDSNKSNLEINDNRLLKIYLDKKGVKYPNNFDVFYFNNHLDTPSLKELRKSDMKLVDAFMKKNGIFGETVKKILHVHQGSIRTNVLKLLLNVFPTSWVLQDKELVSESFKFDYHLSATENDIKSLRDGLFTDQEFKNLFLCLRDAVVNRMINLISISDHIRFYIYLRSVGEKMKWKSKNYLIFKDEHLDWSDKYEHYKKGYYSRIYPQSMDEVFKIPIVDGDDVYYPIVLKNSDEYNSESQIQSNCVKGYIGRPSSIIISLRKDSTISEDRATIEYQVFKEEGKVKFNRPQSLGKFNSRLDDSWNSPLKMLDERMKKWIGLGKEFSTVKLEKEIVHNGIKLFSDSDWSENGFLFWTYNAINKENYSPEINFNNELEF